MLLAALLVVSVGGFVSCSGDDGDDSSSSSNTPRESIAVGSKYKGTMTAGGPISSNNLQAKTHSVLVKYACVRRIEFVKPLWWFRQAQPPKNDGRRIPALFVYFTTGRMYRRQSFENLIVKNFCVFDIFQNLFFLILNQDNRIHGTDNVRIPILQFLHF